MRSNLKNIKNKKAVNTEECITQYKLSADLLSVIWFNWIPPRWKTWELKDAGMREEFEQRVTMKCQTIPSRMEKGWKPIKHGFLEAADEICGWTQGGCQQHKETWWWNETG